MMTTNNTAAVQAALKAAKAALASDSNDAEHDALYELVEALTEFFKKTL